MGNFRRGTPTDALNVITDTLPLDLFIKSQVVKAYLRLYPTLREVPLPEEIRLGRMVGHIQYSRNLALSYNVANPELADFMPVLQLPGPRKFRVVTDSFSTGTPVQSHLLHCYTDGSKVADYHAGAGVVIYTPPTEDTPSIPFCSYKYLGVEPTVFQAEVLAILESCHRLFNFLHAHPNFPRRVIIYSDSQAALQALNASSVKSRLVAQCIDSLNALGASVHVHLRYVKAHRGIPGNEFADYAAKYATKHPYPYLGPILPIPRSAYYAQIKSHTYHVWQKRWMRTHLGQSKIWFPSLAPSKAKFLLTQPRHIYSRVVRYLTGHCHLRRQRHLVDPTLQTPTHCRFCTEEPERAVHILADCPALWRTRL